MSKSVLKRLAWFAYALYLVFGSMLFSCNTQNQNTDTPTEYVYAGKTFAVGGSKEITTLATELGTEKAVTKKVTNDQPVSKKNTLIIDTVELPGVIVTGRNLIQKEMCGIAGGMIWEVRTIEIDTDELELKGDSISTSNTAMQDELSSFPNPSSGQFQIHYRMAQSTTREILVFNEAGQFIKMIAPAEETEPGEYTAQVDLSDSPAGIYFVRMQMKDKALTRKVIITH